MVSPVELRSQIIWLEDDGIVHKPPIPTRLFTSETEALSWLKGFLR